MPITDAVVQTVDAQIHSRHFDPRLYDKFVPEVEDVLRLTAATVGRQETRLKEMHGGPLALLEVAGATHQQSEYCHRSHQKKAPSPPSPRSSPPSTSRRAQHPGWWGRGP